MNLKSIKYFLMACDEGSFTEAATRIGISQPSLSAAIKRLENELGAPLFHRHPHKVTLTEFGKALRPSLEQMDRCADNVLYVATCHCAAAKRREGPTTGLCA